MILSVTFRTTHRKASMSLVMRIKILPIGLAAVPISTNSRPAQTIMSRLMVDGAPMLLVNQVKINPKTYKILNGQLYLFYNFAGYNTLTDWNKNEKDLKSEADQNWKKIVQ